MKLKIILITEEGKVILDEKIDCNFDINYRLEDAPNFLGNIHSSAKYSKGGYLSLHGFIPNHNLAKDFKDAVTVNAINAGHKV